MQYYTNPVAVEAYPITSIKDDYYSNGSLMVFTQNDDGTTISREYTVEMQAKYLPVVGDYWVILQNGHVEAKPAAEFTASYSAATPSVTSTGATNG